jgi:hypothetical protein
MREARPRCLNLETKIGIIGYKDRQRGPNGQLRKKWLLQPFARGENSDYSDTERLRHCCLRSRTYSLKKYTVEAAPHPLEIPKYSHIQTCDIGLKFGIDGRRSFRLNCQKLEQYSSELSSKDLSFEAEHNLRGRACLEGGLWGFSVKWNHGDFQGEALGP